jgi:hypothetical protein
MKNEVKGKGLKKDVGFLSLALLQGDVEGLICMQA